MIWVRVQDKCSEGCELETQITNLRCSVVENDLILYTCTLSVDKAFVKA